MNMAANAVESLHFKYLTVEDGLSNSSVLSVMQDSKGFMWLGTRDGLNKYDGKRITVYRDFFSRNPKGSNVKINSIAEDDANNLWLGTNNGLYFYNPDKNDFKLVMTNYINTILRDDKKRLWIGTTNGFYLLSKPDVQQVRLTYLLYEGRNKKAFSNVQTIIQYDRGHLLLGTDDGIFRVTINKHGRLAGAKENILEGINVITLCKDSVGNIWAGSNKSGVYKIDPSFTKAANYTSGHTRGGILDNNVRKIVTDRWGNVWIGTLKGLNRYRPTGHEFDSYVHETSKPYSLNYNSIYDIYEDRQGSLWVGTYYGGANIKEAFQTKFTIYQNELKPNSLASNIISAIAETPKDHLWVGTEAEGLNRIDLKNNKITRLNLDNKKLQRSNLVKALFKDNNEALWVGFFNGGLTHLKDVSKKITNFTTENSGLNSNNVTAIAEDGRGELWVGHQDYGINVIKPGRNRIFKIEEVFPAVELEDSGITYLYKDSKNNMFVGTRTGAWLSEYNADNSKQTIKRIFPLKDQKVYINCIVEDDLKRIWMGTSIGLVLWNANKIPVIYTTNNGLPSDKVVGIIPLGNDNLWLSTNGGLSKFSVANNHFSNYNIHDGLPSDVFNFQSFYKNTDGRIFFGSINGLVTFLSTEIEVNNNKPEVALTGLLVNGKQVWPGDETKILHASLDAVNEIKLFYNQSDVETDYAVLNFIKPEKNLSAYKLEGYNNDWVYNNDHKAVFTRLQPGSYKLYIKAANNDGIWNMPAQLLSIRVLPPLWKTWWAYCLYFLLVLLSIFMVFRFLNSRAALKRKLYYEHELYLRQQELQKMKTDFFTHMSHELRTPLTLILGPTEMLLENVRKKHDEKMLVSIKSNAERLLNLTNGLMTLLKAESGVLNLNVKPENLVQFVQNIFDNFSLLARQKDMRYSLSFDDNPIIVKFDRHYLEIVITNLLSNAVKFTPVGGEVKLSITNRPEMVDVAVCDNGPGIDDGDAGGIFTQFFQAPSNKKKNEGSGVGLALSKKIMLLHEGELTFRSSQHNGGNQTCFILSLKKDV